MRNQVSEFALGFTAPFLGVQLIASNRRIMKWAFVPFFVGLVVVILGAFFGLSFLAGLLPVLVTNLLALIGLTAGATLFTVTFWLTLLLAWPMALFALFYLLFMIARLIGAPFLALLAERVLIERGYLGEKPFEMRGWIALSLRMFGVSLMKLIVFGLLGVLLFLLSLIPGLGLVTGFGFLLLIAFDAADSAFETFEMNFGERISFARRHLTLFCGLAAALGLAFLIPGLNFVLLPAAIAGATDRVGALMGSKSNRKMVTL